MIRSVLLLLLVCAGCASSQDVPVGVSTAPRSVPRQLESSDPASDAGALEAAAAEPAEPAIDASAPSGPTGRLHAITGMVSGGSLVAKTVIARIEAAPDVLAACSTEASREPNAPDGTWNVKLTVHAGRARLELQSPVEPAFESCLLAAAKRWQLGNVGTGEMMVLLGLAH